MLEDYPGGITALLIGNTDYRRGWSDLKEVEADLARIERLLRSMGLEDANIRVERNRSRDEMERDLAAFFVPGARSGKRLAIFYYAGHGSSAENGYLVPVDAPLDTDRAAFRARAYSMSALFDLAAGFKPHDILYLIDSCYAGTLLRQPIADPAEPAREDVAVRQVIAAVNEGDQTPDDGGFTRSLESGLLGAADLNLDGWITGSELGTYVRSRLMGERGGSRVPTFGNRQDSVLQRGEIRIAPLRPTGGFSGAVARGHELTAGRPFQNCSRCPVMVAVPPEVLPSGTDGPAARGLAVGQYEVMREEWDACVADNRCAAIDDGVIGQRRSPATGVTLEQVRTYVDWLKQKTKLPYRLPTPTEWAALAAYRGSTSANGPLPPGQGRMNCSDCGTPWDGRPASVGSSAADALGLYDLFGNVWEFATCAPAADPSCTEPVAVVGGAYSTSLDTIGFCPPEQVSGAGQSGVFERCPRPTVDTPIAAPGPEGSAVPAAVGPVVPVDGKTRRGRNIGFRVVRDL
jgi:hypothetical protein